MKEIETYFNWLCREHTPSYVMVKNGNGKIETALTSNPSAEVSNYIDSDYKAIWATVHRFADDPQARKKEYVSAYQYLALDIDNKIAHSRNISANGQERGVIFSKALEITDYLTSLGLPQPLIINSGNGYLLLFPIDLPYTQFNYDLLNDLGAVLGKRFDDDICEVDQGVVKDPTRILGVVGTINRGKIEVPNEDRYHTLRSVVGSYPQNKPMNENDFVAIAQKIIADNKPKVGLKVETESKEQALSFEHWNVDQTTAKERAKTYLGKMNDATSGQGGHNATLQAACECYRFGLADRDAWELLQWFNDSKCQPSWSIGELRHKLESAKSKIMSNGKFGSRLKSDPIAIVQDDSNAKTDYPTTDMGNAEFFVETFGNDLKYVSQWRCWLNWNGKIWATNNNRKVQRMAHNFIRKQLPQYATTIKDDDKRAKYLKWAGVSQSEAKVKSMLALAENLLAISADELNFNGNLFNCNNGTIELDTLNFREHKREDLLTKKSNVHYDSGATCPQWDNFIARIFQDGQGKPRVELIKYVQECFGYALTSETSEQAMFILYGNGRNGKSTFMESILNLLGEYGKIAQPSLLSARERGNNSDDIADLFGVRLASISETDEGMKFDEQRVKSLADTGPISAMRKYEQAFTFPQSHKLFLHCNHKPKVRGTDEGIWRRLKLIPFDVKISDQERDEHLGEKLKQESSGILNWLIAGLRGWFANGKRLIDPKEVREATNNYRAESDVMGQFIFDCIDNDPYAKERKSNVYERYTRWAKDNGFYQLNNNDFGRRFIERGYAKKNSNGIPHYYGCSIRPYVRDEEYRYAKDEMDEIDETDEDETTPFDIV